MEFSYGYVQVALWLQIFVWFNLYHARIKLGKIFETLFYLLGMGMILMINITQPYIGYFTPQLLTQYVIYITASVGIFSLRFNFREALCLGFLTVFLNSFFWELFYHIYEFQLWFPHSLGFEWWHLRIPQWIRIMPAFFIAKNFQVKDRRWLTLGLVISFALTYLRFTILRTVTYLLPINRIICLSALVYTIYISPQRERLLEGSDG